MRTLAGSCLLVIVAVGSVGSVVAAQPCVANGPYFGSAPTAGVSLFAPGVASTQWHDDWPPVFSPDGREVVLRVLGFVGEERRGTLFVSRTDDSGCWSVPKPLPFSGTTMDGAVAFGSDGRELFFSSKRRAVGDPEDFTGSRVWVSKRQGEDWAEPLLLDSPVNAFNVNGGFSLDQDGNIFASIETDSGVGAHDIHLVRQVDGAYPIVEPLPGGLNTDVTEVAPFIDPELRFLIYTTTLDDRLELRLSLPDGAGGWAEGRAIPGLEGQSPKFAALSGDGERLFFVSERSGEGANPPALWSYEPYGEPVYDDNADLFWLSSEAILDMLGDEPQGWKPSIEISGLGEGLYRLTTDQGAYTTNSLVFVGSDGVLLVDTQSEDDAVALKRLVDGFHRGDPKIIVLTHRHVEHVGGVAMFGEEPLVIGHDLVRTKLRSGSYLFDEFPEATLPDLSFGDRMKLFFNGEVIDLVAMAGSHDDNEIMAHFTGLKVVHLSSLTNGFNLPSADGDGDVLAFAPLIARAMEELPEDVVIVSGHNDNGSWQDLQPYHEMLVGTVDAVRAGMADGLSLEELREAKVLDPWKAYAGSYVSTDQWIEYIVDAIESPKDPNPKKDIFAELYFTLNDQGTEAALDRYVILKAEHEDEYDFNEFVLLAAGSKLLAKERGEPAAAFLELSTQEFPESEYLYYSFYLLAQAHLTLGQTADALTACRKALELKPDNATIMGLLAEIEGDGVS
jgi:glyoxylase-like metal-dependent hydrolase (beta-lactamase superfamily II)